MKSIFDGRTFHLKSKYTVMNIGAKYCNNVATAAFPSLIEGNTYTVQQAYRIDQTKSF